MIRRVLARIISRMDIKIKILFYYFISDISKLKGTVKRAQPILLKGKGEIIFGQNVRLGIATSPRYHNTYAYLEARNKSSRIIFGNNIICNNNLSIISNGSDITIGDDTSIGTNCEIYDCDFHNISPSSRNAFDQVVSLPVTIGKNVWVGNSVKILKGVTIGNNSIVGAGAIVTSHIPENVIAAGVPAKIIATLN